MKAKNKAMRGFTLVELMIVVAIIGVLAALAIYGVTRYMAYSKTSEAKNSIGAISRAATASFERQTQASEALAEGQSSGTASNNLCATATTPVPDVVTKVAGTKYQPITADGSDYNDGDAVTGWKCLGFSMTQPQLYQYHYTAGGQQAPNNTESPCAADCYAAEAQGDLDGDGVTSWFARTGQINTATGSLLASTTVFVDNEYE